MSGKLSTSLASNASSLGLTRRDLVMIARNSFTAAMMTDDDRRAAQAEFDAAVAEPDR